jgi:hypothetical protein
MRAVGSPGDRPSRRAPPRATRATINRIRKMESGPRAAAKRHEDITWRSGESRHPRPWRPPQRRVPPARASHTRHGSERGQQLPAPARADAGDVIQHRPEVALLAGLGGGT